MASATSHPIIALWVHPRSMSTAIERIMRERGDLECLHEPFMYYYYVGLGKRELPHSDLHIGRLTSFDEIIRDMRSRTKNAAVFFKDMGYYVLPEIYNHPQLASEMQHLVLIRDPRKSILSYYKLDPEVSQEEIGVESQFRLYTWLRDNGVNPRVIEAEAVQENPQAVMLSVWQHLGLDYRAEAFSWQADDVPEDWKSVSGWHQSVMASDGIRKSAEDEAAVSERFSRAAAENPRLRSLLDHHWPFYEKLRTVSRG